VAIQVPCSRVVKVQDLGTPALVVDAETFAHNLDAMAATLPGSRCRPHVKAHKTTALAREQAARGHRNFTCATPREMEGMARAGLGADLLLANEVVDPDRLERLARLDARVTLAVDSAATIEAAVAAGIREVLVDVDVGMFRCGCQPEDAGRLADAARRGGLEVRGVMGYEGHVMGVEDRATRVEQTEQAMQLLLRAHRDVGGDIVSAGGTCNFEINTWASEIQAGTYALMDTAYTYPDLPFRPALSLRATVVSVSDGWAVADCGLKALALDHGNPTVEGGTVWYCADEHVTFAPDRPLKVGDRVQVLPAHIDPTVAKHERMHVVDDDTVLDAWDVDLRGW
jgi:D-threonine aldolase